MAREGRVVEFRPVYIVSFGEMLTPAARALVSRVFSTEVFDRYGTEEVGTIAVECSAHDGMHVNSESVIVEIIDDEGRRVPRGSYGRIIVTDLFNFNMPFIRYDTGDRGVLLTSPCSCGLQTPRIRIEGRYSAYLEFENQRIHHLEFDGALDAFANHIEQYQVVKTAADALEIRVVPAPAFTEDSRLRAKDSVMKLTGQGVSVTVVTVTQIEPTEQGKSRIVIDLTAQHHSA
jgi:phenylacetate-CoA ligase